MVSSANYSYLDEVLESSKSEHKEFNCEEILIETRNEMGGNYKKKETGDVKDLETRKKEIKEFY